MREKRGSNPVDKLYGHQTADMYVTMLHHNITVDIGYKNTGYKNIPVVRMYRL